MPGMIVSVSVSEGDEVKAGDPLVDFGGQPVFDLVSGSPIAVD